MRFCILFTICLVGCVTHSNPDWIAYDAGPFMFSLPPGLEKTDVQGIDSYVGQFKGRDITLSFDYGPYSNDFSDWPESTAYEEARIAGRVARIGTRFYHADIEFPYLTQVYFGTLAMDAWCKTEGDCLTAKRVFRSIRFKKAPR